MFWNYVIAGNHDDWDLRPEPFYFYRDLMPVHLGHLVIEDHGSDRAGCRNLQALPRGGGSEYFIATSFEQCSMVTQYGVIIVDAQNRFATWSIGHLEFLAA